MPISADPDDLLDFSLKIDREKPEQSRPVFKLRYLPEKKATQVDRLLASADRCGDEARRLAAAARAPGTTFDDAEKAAAKAQEIHDRRMGLMQQAIAIGLAGLENFAHEGKLIGLDDLDPGKLELRDILSFHELLELARAVDGEPYIKEAERLGFVSPRASGPAPSADPAAAADVTKSPPTPIP